MTDFPATLLTLTDSELTVSDPAEDIRARTVLDRHGEEVGKVDDLMIDDREHKVRFMRVASGGFLGMGEKTFMIPIDAITRIEADTVHIDQSREHVAGGPGYDPELGDQQYWMDVYGYYGYGPFWGPGYVYPRYPFM